MSELSSHSMTLNQLHRSLLIDGVLKFRLCYSYLFIGPQAGRDMRATVRDHRAETNRRRTMLMKVGMWSFPVPTPCAGHVENFTGYMSVVLICSMINVPIKQQEIQDDVPHLEAYRLELSACILACARRSFCASAMIRRWLKYWIWFFKNCNQCRR